jgi:hypothetical protein
MRFRQISIVIVPDDRLLAAWVDPDVRQEAHCWSTTLCWAKVLEAPIDEAQQRLVRVTSRSTVSWGVPTTCSGMLDKGSRGADARLDDYGMP